MDALTAHFIQQLSDRTDCAPELLERTRRELAAEMDRRLADIVAPSTLFSSAAGTALKEHCAAWHTRALRIARPADAVPCLQELRELEERSRALYAETRREIHMPGSIDLEKLHFFYAAEQEEALQILEEYIRIALFRILAAGGAKMFGGIPSLAASPPTLQGRLTYCRKMLLPALRALPARRTFGVWAFQYKEDLRCGPLGRLPGFCLLTPKKIDASLLPGEYRSESGPAGIMYQGVGMLTNLTPANILSAQGAQVRDSVSARELRAADVMDPAAALSQCGSGWYAVDPYVYFSAANEVESSRCLHRRGRVHQCLYCGNVVDSGAPLCPACIKKVRVR